MSATKFVGDPSKIMKAVYGPDMIDDDVMERTAKALIDIADRFAGDPTEARRRVAKVLATLVMAEHAKAISVAFHQGDLVSGDH